MKNPRIPLVVLILFCLLIAYACQSPGPEKPSFTLPDKQHDLVEKAMPKAGAVTPEKPRKLLVFHLCEGFAHKSITICNKAIQVMGEKTGAFETEFSDQMSVFNRKNLERFDGVLLNNTTQLKFENPEHRQALMEFVKNGKGLIGIHAATDNFPTWPEGAEMIGGIFDGHPWTAGGLWAVKIDEPNHPLNKAFNRKGFLIKDEIYQIKAPYSRKNLRVLLSLDMTNERNLGLNGIKRKDGDFAISWIQPFGKGRVFYCSLGHNDEVFWNPMVLRHYLDGILYAFGDLKADHGPSLDLAQKPQPALTTTEGAVDDPYLNLGAFEFGNSRFTLSLLEERARSGSPESLLEMEQKLIRLLESESTTFAGRQFIFKMLRRIGGKACLPALEKMLTHKIYSDGARFALEGMEHPEINNILIKTIDVKHKALAMGLISTLARRQAREAVQRIGYLTQVKHKELAMVALEALGRIGGKEAANALAKITPKEDQTQVWANACLRCADSLYQEGLQKRALALYSKFSKKEHPTQIRIAAWSGLVKIQKKRSAPFLLGLLEEGDEKILQGASRLIAGLPMDTDMSLFAAAYPSLPVKSRILLLYCFATRNEIQGLPLCREALSGDAEERLAAVKALGVLGGASEVELLSKLAVEEAPIGEAAVASLNLLSGPDTDEAVLKAIGDNQGLARAALIPCLGERSMEEAVSIAMEYAGDETPEVREESLRVLKKLCSEDDLKSLVSLIENLENPDHLSLLDETMDAALDNLETMEEKAAAVLNILSDAPPLTRAHLLGVLAKYDCDPSLQALLTSLEDNDHRVKNAAACALAEWTTAQPLDQVLSIASGSQVPPETASVCLKGAMRMVGLSNERTPKENKELFTRAAACADTTEKQSWIIESLRDLDQAWAIDFLSQWEKDPELKTEAVAAKRNIMSNLARKVSHGAAGKEVTLAFPHVKYDGGSKNALADGKWGSAHFGDGKWTGFKGHHMEAVIDMGQAVKIDSIRAGFLKDIKSWIFPPVKVVFSASLDGEEYVEIKTFEAPVPQEQGEIQLMDFFWEIEDVNARYVRVMAQGVGLCPQWHSGAGKEAWLFADEIQINPHFKGD